MQWYKTTKKRNRFCDTSCSKIIIVGCISVFIENDGSVQKKIKRFIWF